MLKYDFCGTLNVPIENIYVITFIEDLNEEKIVR